MVIDSRMLNFGVSLVGMDIARRLFAGRRIVYFFSWEPTGTPNRMIGKIWPDITVIPLRRASVLFTVLGQNVRLPLPQIAVPVLEPLTRLFLKLVTAKATIKNYSEVFAGIPVSEELKDVIPADYSNYEGWGCHAQALWGGMLNSHPVAKLRLSGPEQELIRSRLAEARGGRQARLCAMYQRLDPTGKGKDRDGAKMAAYLPAIRMLVDEGYQVMLAGDRTLENEAFESFAGMVVDAERLGVDLEFFRLFAQTGADICVGDAGAGMILPTIVSMPMLVLNAYPIAHIGGLGVGSWIYPKRHTDKATGEPIPIEMIFRDDPFGYLEPPENKPFLSQPHPNTKDEITEAVRCFLAELANPAEDDPGRELVDLLPRQSLFRLSGAKLSPAFVRRHHLEQNLRH
jgi:putative glycosyltransferase (TIGR04372 family)